MYKKDLSVQSLVKHDVTEYNTSMKSSVDQSCVSARASWQAYTPGRYAHDKMMHFSRNNPENSPGDDYIYLANSYLATEPCDIAERETRVWFYDLFNRVFFSHLPFRKLWASNQGDEFGAKLVIGTSYIWKARDTELPPNPITHAERNRNRWHGTICKELVGRNDSTCWHSFAEQQSQGNPISEDDLIKLALKRGFTYETKPEMNLVRRWFRESNIIAPVDNIANGQWEVI
jgi:hypothetical protein